MYVNSAPYLIPFLLSALLSFGLAFYTSNFYRMPGARPFVLLTLIQSAWTIAMVLEIISVSLPEKRFWDSLQWLFIFLCMIAVYWFTQSILPVKHVSKFPRWLLFVFPILFMTLLIVNPLLVYPNESISKGFPFNNHEFAFSFLDWVAFAYVYAILVFCIVKLFIERKRSSGQEHRQFTWALAGVFVQAFMYSALFMTGISIWGQRDTAPFTFLVGNLILGWGLFRYGFFELGPMARAQVVENLADAFIVTDASGKIVDMNRMAQGFALPIWNHRNILDTFPGWADEIMLEKFGQSFTHDFVHVLNNKNHSLELKVTPLTDSRNDTAGHLVVVRDISARKQLENALAGSEARYRTIIDSMAEGVILHDETGTIITCNHAAETILGMPCEVLEGRNIREADPFSFREDGTPFPADGVPITTALRTGQAVRDMVMGIKIPSGVVKWLLVNAQPFVFSDDNVNETRQVIISFRDVTEMRRMQAEATRAEIVKERSQLLAQFIVSASHEFRTPLAIIGTSLYLMARQPDPAKRQHHSEIAEGEIKRIEVLLETLVTMVQLDTGVLFKRVPTQITSLIHSTIVKFEKVASDHHIRLQATTSSPLPVAQVDPNYLSMGIEQILDNALRYTPEHGSIDVEVTSEENRIVIKVRDTGLGIPEEDLDHIFDRFWRQDKAHSTPGFGLGLSIVQKVIEQHEGRIEVESKVGQGTLVTIRLPL